MFMNNHALCDALRAFNNYHKNKFIAITKVVPCVDGISFQCQDGISYKYFYEGGYIQMYRDGDWRKK